MGDAHQIPSAPCRLCGGETFIAFREGTGPTLTETCAVCGHQVFYGKHPLFAGPWTLEQAMTISREDR